VQKCLAAKTTEPEARHEMVDAQGSNERF